MIIRHNGEKREVHVKQALHGYRADTLELDARDFQYLIRLLNQRPKDFYAEFSQLAARVLRP